ncbi:MAG: hypothetical protein JRD89_00870 [Deltaproteobacteria bacterium]|nr:hypothetical protein [Deltaproteobacteria bacterium]
MEEIKAIREESRKIAEKALEEWRKRDPLLEDMEGFEKYLQANRDRIALELFGTLLEDLGIETPIGQEGEEAKQPSWFERAFVKLVKKLAPVHKATVEAGEGSEGGEEEEAILVCDTPLEGCFKDYKEIARGLIFENWRPEAETYCVAMDATKIAMLIFPQEYVKLLEPAQLEDYEIAFIDQLLDTVQTVVHIDNDVLQSFITSTGGTSLVRIENKLQVELGEPEAEAENTQNTQNTQNAQEAHETRQPEISCKIYLRAINTPSPYTSVSSIYEKYVETAFETHFHTGEAGCYTTVDPQWLEKLRYFKPPAGKFVTVRMGWGKETPLVVHLRDGSEPGELFYIVAPTLPEELEWKWPYFEA